MLPIGVLGMVAMVLWAWGPARVAAFDFYYDPTDPNEGGNCKSCHPEFDQKGPLHSLHVGSGGFTSTCTMCHVQKGDNPSTGTGADPGNFSCAGCHGRIYDNPAGAGEPVVDGLGLKRRHVFRNGVGTCLACHDLGTEPLPETILPPHYGRADVSITEPCNADGNEDGDGNGVGLDNDGDGPCDGEDLDCQRGRPSRIVNVRWWWPDLPDTLGWTRSPDAEVYQVLRGSLDTLRLQGGSFADAVCADPALPENLFTDPAPPLPGDGWYYLARGAASGTPGTYESDGPGQRGLRDASATACP